MFAVECNNVSKSFKENKVLDGINLQLEEGKIYGMLGRNGAGRTTLMNLMTTRYLPTEGEIKLFGETAYENSEALSKVCMFSDYMEGFTGLKVKDIFKLGPVFFRNWNEDYKEELCSLFEIDRKKRYDALSKGQKTSVAIILGLASGCELTIFDEIYSGLDAVMRTQFYDALLKEYMESNRTFILSTHLIGEMSNIFSDIIIIDHGKVLLNEEVEELKSKVVSLTGSKESLQNCMKEEWEVLSRKEFGSVITVVVKGEFHQKELSEFAVKQLKVEPVPLQDIFVALTTKGWNRGE